MEKFLTRSGESPYSMYLCPILTLQFEIHRVMSILRQIQHYYSCCGLSSSYHVMSSSHVGFVFGKAKLAPHLQPTIPRLELCTAVLAEGMAETILKETDFKPDAVNFYCDSKVVLGYIFNETRYFFV